MRLRAEATIGTASQLNSFSASSTHSLSSDTHFEIEAVSVLSDAKRKETQGGFWPIVFWEVQIAVASYTTRIIIGPGSFPFDPKPAY